MLTIIQTADLDNSEDSMYRYVWCKERWGLPGQVPGEAHWAWHDSLSKNEHFYVFDDGLKAAEFLAKWGKK